jgi:hypothetical protein
LIYSREDEAATPEDMRAVAMAHKAVMEQAHERGIFCAADPLQPSVTATTVRVQDGQSLVTDGPFAETKEQLAGYYVLDCNDLQEAIDWAAKIPTSCGGYRGCIEIRELKEIPGVPESVLPKPVLANAARS